jgi:hypothetical protein
LPLDNISFTKNSHSSAGRLTDRSKNNCLPSRFLLRDSLLLLPLALKVTSYLPVTDVWEEAVEYCNPMEKDFGKYRGYLLNHTQKPAVDLEGADIGDYRCSMMA